MKLLFQHPTTVSGVATDAHAIATSCFDGVVRLFNEFGQVMYSERRASQLNAVALRYGVIASDDDSSTAKTGVAITVSGAKITQADFGLTNVLAIDKTGQFAVHTMNGCEDRIADSGWTVIPDSMGHDKWPMGVEILDSEHIIIVSLDGYARIWHVASKSVIAERLLASNGLNSVDVSNDGQLIVVSHWGLTAGSNPQPGITVLDKSLNKKYEALENFTVVHAVRFLPDNSVVYGTADGRLCQWDGSSPIYTASAPPTPVSKPGKHHK